MLEISSRTHGILLADIYAVGIKPNIVKQRSYKARFNVK